MPQSSNELFRQTNPGWRDGSPALFVAYIHKLEEHLVMGESNKVLRVARLDRSEITEEFLRQVLA